MSKIGIVGYSGGKFDENIAKALLTIAFDIVERDFDDIEIVSGLTDIGIPGLAYRLADERDWKTVGLSAAEAKEYDCYDVDEEIIVGEKFGDESKKFIETIDVLIRVGGGPQSLEETKRAKEKDILVLEYDLPEIK